MKFKVIRGTAENGNKARVFLEDGTELKGISLAEAKREPEFDVMTKHRIGDPLTPPARWVVSSLTLQFDYPEVEFISEPPTI